MGTLNKYMVVAGAPVAAQYINRRSLAANTAETETPPQNARAVLINAQADVWVRWDGSDATVPSGDETDGTGSELNPGWRSLEGVTTFSIICASATVATFCYYKD